MKRFFSFFLCLCLILVSFPPAFSAFADEENAFGELNFYGDDPIGAEEPYIEGGTLYNLEKEVETPAIPEDELPIDEIVQTEEDDEEIYENNLFDTENAAQLSAAEYVSDEIIIKFKEPWQVPGKEKQLQKEIGKLEKVGFVEKLGVYVVRVDELKQNPNAVLNRFKNNKYIEYVEPNYITKIEYIPNDPNFNLQSSVANVINAPAGWGIIKGNSSAVIAVVDTGVINHVDMPPLRNGYSALSNLSPNSDGYGHGTKVAGVLGAVGDNKIGVAGINWNASILPVKVDNGDGLPTAANVAKGVIWAADNGARIINISLATTADSVTVRDAVNYAYERGCVVIAATGNDGKSTVPYPARYSNVIAVGSTSNGTTRVNTSNYGAGIDVVASGTYYTTTATGGYTIVSGTSIASPQVAGLASLILGLNPKLTNDQVYDLIRKGASGNGSFINSEMGYGCINIGKTLELAQATTSAPKPPAAPEPQLPPETPQAVRTPPVITLTGLNELTLEYGQPYVEMGYKAVDCKNVDLTGAVKITNTVNSLKAGLYTVNYEVADSAGLSARATRTVTVNPQPVVVPPATAPKITIIGSNPIVLHTTSGTPYKEQSARAVDHDGKDISNLVTVSGNVNRSVAGTYTLTYSIISPTTGLKADTTRNVRIVAPTDKKDPRVKYGLSGQAKQGGKITHTGLVSSEVGFMDLKIVSIDKNMTITAELVDTATKKAIIKDTFTAAGTKQYKIDKSKYDLVVTVDKASGNCKYDIELLMPETAAILYFAEAEVPLAGLPQIAPIGSNPIILHIGGTPYFEQGARAVDYLGNDITGSIVIDGAPDTGIAGSYNITYTVTGAMGIPVSATREVRILDPNDKTTILEAEVPLAEIPYSDGYYSYITVKGDNLWRIAQRQYGDPLRWHEIYDNNKSVIGSDPTVLKVGQVLKLKVK